jgi:uncharacterized protein YjiS (DUF1127 family)
MTVLRPNVLRFRELMIPDFLRWRRRHIRAEFENLSDSCLHDIGLTPPKRDLDAVKPFWMP